ncbi:hypothetical protein BH23ACI1_BH23ACI1_10300 [soil metagenome]
MPHNLRALAAHCTVALLAIAASGETRAQAPPPQLSEGQAEFSVFIGGQPAGREQVRVARSGGAWVITSSGTAGRAEATANTRFEVRYTGDLHPIESRLEMSQGPRTRTITTSYGGTTATTEVTQDGTTNSKTDQISARTIVLPNNFYAAYEVLAARLATLEAGAELPVYIAPQTEIRMTVTGVTPEQVQGSAGTIATRRYDVSFANPTGPLTAQVTIDDRGRFVRLEIPAATLSVIRTDLASVATRTAPARNPNDSDVSIPAAGFTLAGSVTTPPAMRRMRRPAVILVPGSGPIDRDAIAAGIPIFTQLASALAERGFIVLRYDKRGVGQSGGRTERVTLDDYAEDVVAALRYLRDRRDVDRSRIAVVGYSEGGSVGMLAGARERRISSLVLIAAMGTTGAELILEQQRHLLETMEVPEDERRQKIDLQQRIQQAVVSEEWEGIDEELREQADSTWFRSLLLFDPAEVMPRIRQPILVIQPELDRQVAVHHGQRLAELARERRRNVATDFAVIPGINHLLVPATTGEVSEYGSLPERTVSAEVARRIAEFLK